MYSGVAIIDIISVARELQSIKIHSEKLISTLREVQSIFEISSAFQDLNFSLKLGSIEFR